jgi:hypothetical protein
MNEEIIKTITAENTISYAEACLQLYDELDSLRTQGFQRIVLPSRGAYPFYNGAMSAFYLLEQSYLKRNEFVLHYNLWLLPFTSDWGDSEITISSAKVRMFWSKILADSIRKQQTPYLKFYHGLVKTVGKSYTMNTSELLLDKAHKAEVKDERFIFIDTAISGRAITEIIESFYSLNLVDFYIILIVDNDGASLRPEFKNIIEREKARGKLFQINVKKIFSEDASPLLNTGISSLVFPNLMEHAYHSVKEFQNDGFIGAGLWFVDSVSHLRNYDPNLNGVRGTLASLKFTGLREILYSDNKWFTEMVSNHAQEIVKHAGAFNIYDPVNTKKIVYDRMKLKKVAIKEKFIDVSSSHVIRIQQDDAAIQTFVKSLKL